MAGTIDLQGESGPFQEHQDTPGGIWGHTWSRGSVLGDIGGVQKGIKDLLGGIRAIPGAPVFSSGTLRLYQELRGPPRVTTTLLEDSTEALGTTKTVPGALGIS